MALLRRICCPSVSSLRSTAHFHKLYNAYGVLGFSIVDVTVRLILSICLQKRKHTIVRYNAENILNASRLGVIHLSFFQIDSLWTACPCAVANASNHLAISVSHVLRVT
jgi:hypothetical protein